MNLVYHYTCGDALASILRDATLTPCKIEPGNLQEIPTVIFSSNPVWEKTRYKTGLLPDGTETIMGKDQMNLYCAGLYRIAVDAALAPLTWFDIKDQCGLSKKTISALYALHVQVGAKTSEWFGTIEPVPQASWQSIDKWEDDKWISILDHPRFSTALPDPSPTPVEQTPRATVGCTGGVRAVDQAV
jgi:hypothetical protein